jgi:23S rRNA pseudouridine2605 synthase
LQKLLSAAGVASRRAAERLITEGRISVNGTTVRDRGVKADPGRDVIRVDGRRIAAAAPLRYYLVNKPLGVVTTRSDPQRRRTVLDLLAGVTGYLFPVGRLDYDSEGLLLVTNDGALAARLTHPRHEVAKVYRARVRGVPDERSLGRLAAGIPLDGHRTAPAQVRLVKRFEGARGPEAIVELTLREGRNRQVRRMCEAVGHPVVALARVQFGPLRDSRLPSGAFRELTADEVRRLRESASVSQDVASPAPSRAAGASGARPQEGGAPAPPHDRFKARRPGRSRTRTESNPTRRRRSIADRPRRG